MRRNRRTDRPRLPRTTALFGIMLSALIAFGLLTPAPAGIRWGTPPGGRSGPHSLPHDIFLAGRNITGWNESQVRALLEDWAREIGRAPADARLDPATRGIIPHLNGLEVDVLATLDRFRTAAPGDRLDLAFREVPARVTRSDLSPAPIYQGHPEKHAVTLLINVAWGEEFLPKMLTLLDKHQVRATFFLVGQWVERFPEATMDIARAGHEIASHGYSSAEFAELSAEGVAAEIARAEEAIVATIGRQPRFFSPHKGEISPHLLRVAREKGYETVLWSLDTVDWMKPGVDWMVNRITGGAHNGALILMHPTEQTAAALEPMILGLREKGLRIVTLGTLLSPDPRATDWDETAVKPRRP